MTKHLPSILVQLALVMAAALALTCTEPSSVTCPSGRVCPVGTVCAAAQDVCIQNGCGDSSVDDGEVCDDGNVRDGDGCSDDCLSLEVCGNDIVDSAVGEVCDDDNTEDDDGCSADCFSNELCGNGIIDDEVGEVCDDENNDSEDGCRNDCISDETCGNGELDLDVGETCDDHNNLDGDGCSSDCLSGEGCGNSFLDPGEICDDNNNTSGDGCSADCLSNETCGNDTVDFAAGEVCDGGNVLSGDGCRSDCRSDETCGNDELDVDAQPVNEQCDDGNTDDGDACASDCLDEVCGNGIRDDEFGEACDDGNTSDGPCLGGSPPASCAVDCSAAISSITRATDVVTVTAVAHGLAASDVVIISGVSDSSFGGTFTVATTPDADTFTYAQTAADATSSGGNVLIQSDCAAGFFCSDITGACDGLDACASDCRSGQACGDGTRDPTEECDDGNADYEDNCVVGASGEAVRCELASCGDGFVDLELSDLEDCDGDGDGAGGETEACNADCSTAFCGDGIVNLLHDVDGVGVGSPLTEQCDTEGETAFCDDDCSIAFCGDGKHNPTGGEDCDTAGNSATCNADCTDTPSCGDGFTNPAFDPDDVGPLTGEECDDSGVVSGDGCSSDCQLEDFTLGVTRNGTGTGTVTALPGINCGALCSETYVPGAVVSLTPTATGVSHFMGWSGACTGTGACNVTMNSDQQVVATFDLNRLTIVKNGNSTGTVTGTGINCGATCFADFADPTAVLLTAAPAANTTVTWSVGGCVPGNTCNVNVNAPQTVTVTFSVTTYPLSVSKTGNGTGIVRNTLPLPVDQINCGATCSASFASGASVTLTATATAADSTFVGWTGAGCSGTGNCVVAMTEAADVTANFALVPRILTVDKTGSTGTGSVVSSPSGIDCNAGCASDTGSYNHGTIVGLFATPATGSSFTNWSGGGCSGNGTCFVTMDAAKTVTAVFTQDSYLLSVVKNGTGLGTVRNTLPVPVDTINCGSDCSESYLSGTSVTLSVAPLNPNTSVAWSVGGCSGTTCTFTMDAPRTVTATFTLDTYALTVVKIGTGTGLVRNTSAPADTILCGATCSASFNAGVSVTLTATPTSGESTFVGWSGAGCGGTGTCVVAMTQVATVTADFALIPRNLTLTKAAGMGTVVSSPAGIDCTGACTSDPGTFNHNTVVGLFATPAVGRTFTGWSIVGGGSCPGTTPSCFVTMDADKTVTANFVQDSYLLSVVKNGTGLGTVKNTLPLPVDTINCGSGAGCTASYLSGTSVTLSVAPLNPNTSVAWSVGGCSGNTCTFTMDAPRTVTVTFTLDTYALSVVKIGTGTGLVRNTSAPADTILCGATCSASFNAGVSVTLTATPTSGESTFVGWSGAGCGGTGTCVVAMTQVATVTADFAIIPRILTLNKAASMGTVVSSPAGIDCDGACTSDTGSYGHNTVVGLFATPATGRSFTGWSIVGGGSCPGTTPSCFVTMDAAKTVTANFVQDSYALSVVKNGTGTGTVKNTLPLPADTINCGSGAGCTASFLSGTVVRLNVTLPANTTFSWSVAACNVPVPQLDCDVTMDAAKTVTTTFTTATYTLNAVKTGTGTGLVRSTLPTLDDINCGSTCSFVYTAGTSVTLTATPTDANHTFVGWSGAGCSGTGSCVVVMNQTSTAVAQFALVKRNLTVTKTGDGAAVGTVTTNPTGVACAPPATGCTAFDHGLFVMLTAVAGADNFFNGWSGEGCSGTGACFVSMDAARNVSAAFTLAQFTLNVGKDGTGLGTVTDVPLSLINCGGDCIDSYPAGAMVTLTAVPTTGSTFTGWDVTGAPVTCPAPGDCTFPMSSVRTATATFTIQSFVLTVGVVGTGSVTSNVGTIDCPGVDCTDSYIFDTNVTLTATATIASWLVDGNPDLVNCPDASTTCVVDMTAARTVTATFP